MIRLATELLPHSQWNIVPPFPAAIELGRKKSVPPTIGKHNVFFLSSRWEQNFNSPKHARLKIYGRECGNPTGAWKMMHNATIACHDHASSTHHITKRAPQKCATAATVLKPECRNAGGKKHLFTQCYNPLLTSSLTGDFHCPCRVDVRAACIKSSTRPRAPSARPSTLAISPRIQGMKRNSTASRCRFRKWPLSVRE